MTRRRFSAKALMERLLAFDGRCPECGNKFGGTHGAPEWDHIISLELGGEDEIGNLQPLHKSCHRKKTKADVGHIAKAKRMQQRQAGVGRQSRNSFKTNRNGPFKKTLSGEVVRR